ncbi:MAG: thiamine phosphate synthase [bacterium]
MTIRGKKWSPLQFITNGEDKEETISGAIEALKGGCKWIQLRMKDTHPQTIEECALVLKEECKKYDAVLIIDDHVEIVKKTDVNGVHLGLNDMPIDLARQILGNNFIIGGTANTLEQALHQASLGADYLGIGPYQFTTTKKLLSETLGIDGYIDLMSELREKTKIPVVAIGGIELSNIGEIMKTGVDGIAMSGTILRADSPMEATRLILAEF